MSKEKKQKYEISAKEAIKLNLRALQMFRKLSPWHIELDLLDDIHQTLGGYIGIYVTARIVTELATLRRPEKLLFWVIIMLVQTLFVRAIHYAIFHIQQVKGDFKEGRRWYLIDKKLSQMDYVDAERQGVRDHYFKIRQDEDWVGLGFASGYNFIYFVVNIAGILGAIALSVGFVFLKVPETAPGAKILNSPLTILAITAIIALISRGAVKLGAKAWKLYKEMNDSATLSNRVFWHTVNIPKDENRALDMRIYDQRSTLVHMRRQSVDSGFGKKAAEYFRGKGGIMRMIQGMSGWLTYGVIYIIVGLKAWAGAFGVGQVTQYIAAINNLTAHIQSLAYRWQDMRLNAVNLKYAFDFLDIKNEMYQGSLTTEKRSDREYDIEFRNVSFKYPNTEKWALKNLNVKFKVGSRLAVVGENGSGKTTFIKLLCRLYDPQEGQILLNGIDIKKYDYQDYVGVFSVVFQDYFLLARPIGENVAGAKEYNRDKAEKCLVDAGFGERLKELPKGLDTYLYKEFETDGIQVSGGEAQKIAIARALYKNAPFIILDEPTAALDPIAEAEIYSQFNDIVGDKTAIYISHRLSSCRFCDEILVFDEGGIIQRGNHDSLVEADGRYKELWHAQAQYYAEEEKRKQMEAERASVGM